LTNNKICGIV